MWRCSVLTTSLLVNPDIIRGRWDFKKCAFYKNQQYHFLFLPSLWCGSTPLCTNLLWSEIRVNGPEFDGSTRTYLRNAQISEVDILGTMCCVGGVKWWPKIRPNVKFGIFRVGPVFGSGSLTHLKKNCLRAANLCVLCRVSRDITSQNSRLFCNSVNSEHWSIFRGLENALQ